ncbi:hypothetical protein [Bathymodiolus thermophilus thioautotrophic gill symbiont]|uniref:Uncharacterized protein n=1 Tax=Bathymodiolus thermophilus thioautotrophic gill symbiont TaxID=2360 RepID=A0A1J5TSP3_9GAMM|nr:hypothetical protein [Bathymodiolus thermophilus thioautotrophic gill symbiont]OIR23928.1 hypothetical protein BGC33_08670 [Bathymodiolus thermophilus thioautotrophic gill symbiont]CAB5502998.1 hypothetical protein THERMOS_1708 [Bathymodiolus thermophilus thioautotrophic gill symbiont]
MESKMKYLGMIQSVISRMAGNSFLLKGWSVTLISALFALAAKDSNQFFVYLTYFPCIAFWSLDGYFLWQERMYRKLYQEVIKIEAGKIDFSLNAEKFKNEVDTWLDICFSVTLRRFHGTIFSAIVLIMLINICIEGN